jgi:D-alanyl-D-alanine carboxypeptidase (penicillin-binding protein 5/6)
MVTAYRQSDAGLLDLAQPVVLNDADKVPGSGILTDHFSDGLTLSLRDAIRLMIRYSDNTATNLVVDRIGLPATAEGMEVLGLSQTRLNSKVYRGETSIAPERSRLFGLGSTTAVETVELLHSLHSGTAASPESCKAMLEHLSVCEDATMLAAALPAGTKIAHKTGAVSASRCDAGIIFGPKSAFAICVLTTDNDDRSWNDDNAAHVLMGRLAAIAFDHFNPPWERGRVTADAELRLGAFGQQVESLQRTLNARLVPSPGLGVDGDFGPATEAAVRRFEEVSALDVDGVVDAGVWKALGVLEEAKPVDPPEVVNAMQLPRLPADSLAGPPIVTCDAWIAVNAADGAIMGGKEVGTRKNIASTTKIMTAWLVIRMSESDPSVLDEMLTVSSRADDTRGSTADLRAGEQVSVREALYGLMLPSGNDMSVALAEHFGPRLVAGGTSGEDPLRQFVQAMNDEASRLGLSATSFDNPHGLTSPRHLSSVQDLARLAQTAFGSETFRRYVATRQHGATVTGPGGYQRNVVWKNTNELLGIEGFDGIKTGTTDQAGACLVSTGERDGQRLIVVVLGSAASESRYADSRNLYRWAWQELQSQSSVPAK